MVLVHRLMETDAVWYRVLPMLAARGRVVALNLARAGLGGGAGAGVDDLAEFVYQRLQELGMDR